MDTNTARPASPPGQGDERPANAANDETDASMRRAEEMVDRVAAWLGMAASVVGRVALRVGARVREEAEDMWAEAQSIRRGEKPPDQG